MRQRIPKREQSFHIHIDDNLVTSGTFPCKISTTDHARLTTPLNVTDKKAITPSEATPSTTISDLTSNTHYEPKISIDQPKFSITQLSMYKSLKEETEIAIKRHEETLKELAKH